MPKIIENVRGKIIDEAQKQINENGYESVTIRSIARSCGLGLGTFYNYFKSKDLLIATFLLEDWQQRMTKVSDEHNGELDPMVIVHALHLEVKSFIEKHHAIFSAPSAIKTFSTTSPGYHKFVREQVSEPIYRSCVLNGMENPEFLALFVAESVITWTVDKREYDEISSIISKLFVK